MRILIFGNILIDKDNLALKLIPKLKKNFPEIEFKEFDPTESLENEIENGGLRIIDVAEGIDKVQLIENIEQLERNRLFSMHDFDLAYNLKLLDKIDRVKKIKIICIPMGYNEKEAFNQIQLILRKWVAQDMQGS